MSQVQVGFRTVVRNEYFCHAGKDSWCPDHINVRIEFLNRYLEPLVPTMKLVFPLPRDDTTPPVTKYTLSL